MRGLSTRRLSDAALWGAALVLIAVIVAKAFLDYDTRWDSNEYHLPFAALHIGLIGPEQFQQAPWLVERYAGFPSFIYLLKGALWRATGSPQAAILLNPLAILVLAGYCAARLRIAPIWTLLVFLAIPTLHAALALQYVDLWTNAFFALHLVAASCFLYGAHQGKWIDLALSLAGAAIAVNSKPQFYAVGGLSIGLLCLILAARSFRRQPARSFLAALGAVLLASLLIFYAPLKNAVRFGNPFYPVQLQVAGVTLPGPEQPVWPIPSYLAEAPQPLRWALSQVEFGALSGRPGGYSHDQWAPDEMQSSRMGGSSPVLMIIAGLGLLLAARRAGPVRRYLAPAGAGLVIVAAVSALPGSHELRYFSFVNITLVLAASAWLGAQARGGDQVASGALFMLRGALVGSFLFVAAVTRLGYLEPRGDSLQEVLLSTGVRADLSAALQTSREICLVGARPFAFLYAPLFHRQAGPYRVVQTATGSDCPAGSAVLPRSRNDPADPIRWPS